MNHSKRAAPGRFGWRGIGVGGLKLILAGLMAQGAAASAWAGLYTLRASVCPGGVCEGKTAQQPCQQYADARITYSQNNPTDHNKWVSASDLTADVPGDPNEEGCKSGTCKFSLKAQNGYVGQVSANISHCVPVVEEDRTKEKDTPCFGNPIFPAEGRKRESVAIDLGLAGLPGGITYDTGRRLPTASEVRIPSPDPVLASFGELWYGGWHRKIWVDAPKKNAQLSRGNGRVISFIGDGSGTFRTSDDIDGSLAYGGGMFTYLDRAEGITETYSGEGVLQQIRLRDGRSFAFTYSDGTTSGSVAPGIGYLIKVADRFGREVRFGYHLDGRVVSIHGPALATDTNEKLPSIAADYDNGNSDGIGNLTSLTWQDGKSKTFLYENSALPWALTGIKDEELQRYSTFSYDPQGRAISTEHGVGVGRYAAIYGAPPSVIVTDRYDAQEGVIYRTRKWQLPLLPQVLTPNGPVDLKVDLVADHVKVTGRSQSGGSGCDASSSETKYDLRGNATVRVDFAKNLSCHAYASNRNLETIRIEGLRDTPANRTVCDDPSAYVVPPNTAQRKVTTEWHPTQSLETRRAEPKRITTTVYNGQVDPVDPLHPTLNCAAGAGDIVVVCRRYEQSTNDDTGNLGFSAAVTEKRSWNYDYNQYGQVTKEIDPRGKSTTYDYFGDTSFTGDGNAARGHWKGDLQRVTNALQQKTEHLEYNKRGQVLTKKFANGSQEQREYHARGWLTKVTLMPAGGGAGQVTQYDYFATGLLKKVTQPDGSYASYTWDDAHRLKEVEDSVGNKVVYELDNAGNRTAEKFKDPTGALAKTISRTFDALGRMDSSTGAQ